MLRSCGPDLMTERAAQPPTRTSIPGWTRGLNSNRSPVGLRFGRSGVERHCATGISALTLPEIRTRPRAPTGGLTVTMEMPGRDALITTKLGVQARGRRYVDRERLRARLDDAAEARLVLVSAPAGFGKSTLLADWLGQPGVRGAWVSLDARDNDIVRFARYLAAATARLAGNTEDTRGVRRRVLRSRARPRARSRPRRGGRRRRRPGARRLPPDRRAGGSPVRRVARRAPPPAGPRRDRHARRSAAPARPPARPRRAPRGSRRRPPLHGGRGDRARAVDRRRAHLRGGRGAHRPNGGVGGGVVAGGGLAARPTRPCRAGAAVRSEPPLHPRLRRRGGPRRAAARDPGVPPADLDPRPPLRSPV